MVNRPEPSLVKVFKSLPKLPLIVMLPEPPIVKALLAVVIGLTVNVPAVGIDPRALARLIAPA